MSGSERHYPKIADRDLYPFVLVQQHLDEDPTFLERAECPYSGEVKRFLLQLQLSRAQANGGAVVDEATDLMESDTDQLDLEKEIVRILKELTSYGKSLGKDETAEKSAYFRLSTSLMDKLVTLRERANSLGHVKAFESVILDFLEEYMTADVRTQLMDRLKEELAKA